MDKKIKKIIKIRPQGKLLDICCGDWLFIKLAQKFSYEVIGTEISKYAVEKLKMKDLM